MKKRFCLLMLFVLIISIFASCLVACNEKNRLEEAYDNIMGSYNIIDKYSSSSDPTTNYIKLADDKSYIKIDSNPKNIDNYWGESALSLIKRFNLEFGFSDYVYEKMMNTTVLQGEQKETNNGITVTWTYSSYKGLEVIYTEKNSKISNIKKFFD